MSLPAASYFDAAEDIDLYMMAAQKLGLVSAGDASTFSDWWEWYGDPSQQRRRLRWLIDPFPPVSLPDTAVAGSVISKMAQDACDGASISRGSDSNVAALRRACRVWAGYTET